MPFDRLGRALRWIGLIVALNLATACALLDGVGLWQGRAGSPQVGIASWYDPGRRTVRGVAYDSSDFTAAHRSLPFGTRLRVTNLQNGRRVVVVVNDRGPYVRGRIVDLSPAAARRLGIIERGLARVRIEVVGRAPAEA